MARTYGVKNFELSFEINFSTIIRGHHVYKNIWTSSLGQVLLAKPQLELVGHAPVELSRLLNHFLKAHVGNSIYVEVTGKRKREVGLVVPAKFSARTKSTRTAKILDEQLDRIKEKFTTLEFKHRQKRLYRKFPIYQKIK